MGDETIARTGPALDFIVIGASKSGTTDLWRGLTSHPRICTPQDKERGFFNSEGRYAKGLDDFTRLAFAHAEHGQKRGTVTPGYMMVQNVETVVRRMRRDVPEVRLVAILRDPIERAVSQFRAMLREGKALGTTFEEHVRAVAEREGREVAAGGDYGRILMHYLTAFSREQLLILFTEDLARDPGVVYRRTFEHLGVDPGHVPPGYPDRLNVGGTTRRVTPEALELIRAHMDEHVWPHVPDSREPRRGFDFWLKYLWNTEPDDAGKAVGPELRASMEQRFLNDAETLRDSFGVEPPWVAAYQRRRQARR